jgi:hypothetical protein
MFHTVERRVRQQNLEQQYNNLLSARPSGISLRNILELGRISPKFSPHPNADLSNANVKAFAQKYGIWLDGLGEHNVTMTPYLNRSAISEPRLTLAGKVNCILFYLDDTVGTEQQKNLTSEEKESAKQIMRDLLAILETGQLNRQPTNLERATIEVVKELAALTNPIFMNRLIEFVYRHLELGTVDQDTGATSKVLDPDTYIEMRNHVSGMYPTIVMMEMTSDNFVTREDYERVGVYENIERLRYLCATLGAIVNDCFSFEKEVIDAKDDFNLITVIMLNDPQFNLYKAILSAAEIINNFTREFFDIAVRIRRKCANTDLSDRISEHVSALTDSVEATWHWQISTERYRRDNSIWQETRKAAPTVAPAGKQK